MSIVVGIESLGDKVHVAIRRLQTGYATAKDLKVADALVQVLCNEIKREVEVGLIPSATVTIDNDKRIDL